MSRRLDRLLFTQFTHHASRDPFPHLRIPDQYASDARLSC